jgi:hypothetical protein
MADNRDHRRPKSHPLGIPAFVEEDVTGNFAGPELQAMRARRPTPARLLRLEDKHDKLDTKVDGIAQNVAEMRGELRVLPELVSVVRNVADRAAAREHVTFTAQVDVEKERAVAGVRKWTTYRDWATRGLAIVSTLAALVLALVEAGRC